jgi:aryl-alcohol dehydrogenase-like predicted oxidoreductase
MEYRRLGRTGHSSSVAAFGTFSIAHLDQGRADQAVQTVLDHGVNHFDVAPTYGDAELRLQPWMSRIRETIFLGCKTKERTREAAKAQLHRSLERLGTDRLNLYQLHAVSKLAELDACTARGGALEALLEARDEGLVDWLGITSHTHDAPRTLRVALERFPFDTVMFPLNFVLWADADYRRDADALLSLCRERGVGVHAIKAIARAPWGDRPKTLNTWYEPFTEQATIDKAVAFSLSRSVTTLCSVGDATLLPRFLDAADRFRPQDERSQAELLATAPQYASPFVGTWA